MLEQLGLITSGSKAVLRERLRKTIEGEGSKAQEADNDGALKTDNPSNIEKLTKAQLTQKLRELTLPVTGSKAELREKLKTAMQEDDSNEEDEGDDDAENEEETAAVMRTRNIGSYVGNVSHTRKVTQPSSCDYENEGYGRADGRRYVII